MNRPSSPAIASIARLLAAVACLLLVTACATTTSLPPPEARHHLAARELNKARSGRLSIEDRLAHYLKAAEEAAPLLGKGEEAPAVRSIYNSAVAEFTVLLRSANSGSRWNKPLTVGSGATAYRLRYAPASRQNGTWDPAYFTSFETPKQVHENRIRIQVRDAGYGATLVGIRRTSNPKKDFFPDEGVAGAVTAVLDFKSARSSASRDVLLSLHDPTLRETVRIAGSTRPLAADFTAPLAFYPAPRFLGLMEAIHADRYYRTAALTLLQPYDPNRIPIICVHGLISDPSMWSNTIDAVESDPELRGRFQFWAFGYPSGDPISLSALQLRESLAAVYQRYPQTKDMVLVSHSLGGLLSQMQTINTGRALWDGVFEGDADRLYAKVPSESIVKRALIFEANPKIKRVIFICVPHRGSPMADGMIGAIGISLIHLPGQFLDGVRQQLGHTVALAMGKKGFVFPPSVHGLSPSSTLLHSMDAQPIVVPYHTIAGDRGKGDTPKSSDGVVPYESSHLDRAQSEIIVPGPHGSYGLPQTVKEVQRILRLHLKKEKRAAGTVE